MTELIIAIRAHQWLAALIIAIPLTIGLTKVVLKNTKISAWAAGLPSWVRWGAANLASGATVFVALVTQGVPVVDAILGAVLAALGVEGVFNAQKHARSMVSTKGAAKTLPALLLLVLPGCAALQSQPVQTGLDVAHAICNNTLLRSPDVQRMLLQSGVLPEAVPAVIEATCAALPGLEDLLAQADKARAPRARVLVAEAKARGLL